MPVRRFSSKRLKWTYNSNVIAFVLIAKGCGMDYPELLNSNVSPMDIQKYLVGGETSTIAVRIPKNLRDSAKEAAELRG